METDNNANHLSIVYHVLRVIVCMSLVLFILFDTFSDLSLINSSYAMSYEFDVEIEKIVKIRTSHYIAKYACLLVLPITFDLFNSHIIYPIFGFIAAIGSIIIGASKSYSAAIAGAVLLGIGLGTNYVGFYKIITEWFQIKHVSIAFGGLFAINIIILVISTNVKDPLLQVLTNRYGWRSMFYFDGAFFLIASICLLIIKFLKNQEEDEKEENIGSKFKSLCKNIGQIYKTKYFYLMTVYHIIYGGMYEFWANLIMNYVFDAHQSKDYKTVSIMHGIGRAVGFVALPVISHFTKQRKWIMFAASAIFGLLSFIMCFTGKSAVYGGVCFVIFILSMISFPILSISIPLFTSYFDKSIYSYVSGIGFLACFIAGEAFREASIILTNGKYTENSWKKHLYGLWVPATALSIISVVIAFFLKDQTEEETKSEKEEEKGPMEP